MTIRKAIAALAVVTLAGCAAGAIVSDPPGSEPGTVIYAVGDIGRCGRGPAVASAAARTAALLKETTGAILALGDFAYPKGSERDFARCFAPTWGELKARILPVPGNHEYQTPSAAPYYAYFGAAAGEPGKGYYSARVGAWHIVALNSNIDVSRGSQQSQWLVQQLTAHGAKCTLVFWHHPAFASTRRGNNPAVQDIWRVLYAAGADVVINGHEHLYERFAPQTPEGASDPLRGMRQFIAGTGGGYPGYFSDVQSNSEARGRGVYGVLKLTLREDSYAWQFVPVAGQTFGDSGEGRCHD